jgi:hypothetical protein
MSMFEMYLCILIKDKLLEEITCRSFGIIIFAQTQKLSHLAYQIMISLMKYLNHLIRQRERKFPISKIRWGLVHLVLDVAPAV